MSSLRPLLALVAAAAATAGCDTSSDSEPGPAEVSVRSAEARIVTLETAPVGRPTSLELHADPDSLVVWAVMDHPPDPGARARTQHSPGTAACVAGIGSEASFVPPAPGTYGIRALVLEPETLEVRYEVETEVTVEGRQAVDGCMADGIPFGLLPSIDEVGGIQPTPFHEDVAGVEPTPFAVLFGDGVSLSAGCFCAYE